jgi:hypothetical protein
MRTFLLRAVIGLIAVLGYGSGGTDAASRRELAAAPLWVRDLHCRDIVTPDATEILAGERFRGWFEEMMAPVADRGLSMDDMYTMLLVVCSKDQNWGIVDAVIGTREAVAGLTIGTAPSARGRR